MGLRSIGVGDVHTLVEKLDELDQNILDKRMITETLKTIEQLLINISELRPISQGVEKRISQTLLSVTALFESKTSDQEVSEINKESIGTQFTIGGITIKIVSVSKKIHKIYYCEIAGNEVTLSVPKRRVLNGILAAYPRCYNLGQNDVAVFDRLVFDFPKGSLIRAKGNIVKLVAREESSEDIA